MSDMTLYWAPSSPFVRKVMIAARELGVADRFELVEATVDNIIELVSPVNPLAQIPTLVTDEGDVIFDSPNIVLWLDGKFDGSLCGRNTAARWAIASRQTVATGLIEAAVTRRHLAAQPDGHRPDGFITRLKDRGGRALDHLEKTLDPENGAPGSPITADAIACFCALGYLDFRYPDEDWRSDRPALAAWHAAAAERPAMAATQP